MIRTSVPAWSNFLTDFIVITHKYMQKHNLLCYFFITILLNPEIAKAKAMLFVFPVYYYSRTVATQFMRKRSLLKYPIKAQLYSGFKL